MGVAAGWCVRGIPPVRMPVAASVALVAVVVGFTVWAGATHSEQVLPRRDAASNLQAAVSLASTGSRVVAVDPESVGGPGVLDLPGVTLASPAFFEVGSSADPAVQPQFVVGPAVVYAFGWWAGGAGVALVLPALAMGLALLALGLLVARVAGAWAGVATAAVTGILFPVLHTARATYSEPLAMLTLTAGLLAATLAVAAGRDAVGPAPAGGAAGPDRWRAPGPVTRRGRQCEARGSGEARGQSAEARGGGGPRHPASSVTRRRRGWCSRGRRGTGSCCETPRRGRGCWPACSWVAPGWCGSTRCARSCCCCRWWRWGPRSERAGPGPCWWGSGRRCWSRRSRPSGCRGSTSPRSPAACCRWWRSACWSVGCRGLALVLWRRGWRLPAVVVRWLPDVAAAGVVVVGLYLAGRPLWQVVRQSPDDPGARYVAGMQARQGLPVDGGRTYAEQTVAWLSWYVGPVALVVALVVLAVLVRRAVLSAQSRRVDAWLPALLVASGSTLLTLLRPGITPDHPWADRRLLIALPLVVALVVTGLGWVVRRAAAADRAWLGVAVAACRRRPRRRARAAGDVAAPGRWCRAGVAGRRGVGVRRAGAR